MLNAIIKMITGEREYKADEVKGFLNGSVKCDIVM
jgi:hypothetical protein